MSQIDTERELNSILEERERIQGRLSSGQQRQKDLADSLSGSMDQQLDSLTLIPACTL
jgi:hypothetical protein